MRPSRRNKGPTVVIVNESSKSSSFNEGEECEEQVRDYLVANKETIDKTTWNNGPSKNLAKMEDIVRVSGTHMESGGRITFYLNTTKNIGHERVILLLHCGLPLESTNFPKD